MSPIQLAILEKANAEVAHEIRTLRHQVQSLCARLGISERQVRDLAHRNELLARDNARLASGGGQNV